MAKEYGKNRIGFMGPVFVMLGLSLITTGNAQTYQENSWDNPATVISTRANKPVESSAEIQCEATCLQERIFLRNFKSKERVQTCKLVVE